MSLDVGVDYLVLFRLLEKICSS